MISADKYIGMDVHQATISIAVLDSTGKLVMESIIETKAATILQFFHGLRGNLHVTFEEGTCAAWLYDLLKPPRVTRVVVCDPRKNALLKAGNKNDRIDARKLAELLRAGLLSPVYHGETGIRTLKELARSYLTIAKDLTRVMNRLKALYRSWAIPCAGKQVYAPHYRAEWLQRLPEGEAGLRRRAERLYHQLDLLQFLRKEARRELLAESRKHPATRVLRQIPRLGPIRVALLVALVQTPHRFRTKRQLWAYSGLALETRTSAEYRYVEGQLRHSKKLAAIYGLNANHNHDLKNIFKSTATAASVRPGPFRDFYDALLAKGMKPSMARLTPAALPPEFESFSYSPAARWGFRLVFYLQLRQRERFFAFAKFVPAAATPNQPRNVQHFFFMWYCNSGECAAQLHISPQVSADEVAGNPLNWSLAC